MNTLHVPTVTGKLGVLDNRIRLCAAFQQLAKHRIHYSDVIMGAMASQITSLTIVCSTIYSGADQRKHQSSASLAFVRWIHRWPVNSPHKWPVTRKMFPFDDVIIFDTTRTGGTEYTFVHLSVLDTCVLAKTSIRKCLPMPMTFLFDTGNSRHC